MEMSQLIKATGLNPEAKYSLVALLPSNGEQMLLGYICADDDIYDGCWLTLYRAAVVHLAYRMDEEHRRRVTHEVFAYEGLVQDRILVHLEKYVGFGVPMGTRLALYADWETKNYSSSGLEG